MASETEAFASNTLFTEVLGTHTKTLILVSLIAESNRWLTKTDIARLAGVTPRTVRRHIDTLEDYDVVRSRPGKDGYQVYKLNRDSEAAKRLAQMEWSLIEIVAEKEELSENEMPGSVP